MSTKFEDLISETQLEKNKILARGGNPKDPSNYDGHGRKEFKYPDGLVVKAINQQSANAQHDKLVKKGVQAKRKK